MGFKHNRPDGIFTATDKRLSAIAQSVEQFLRKDGSPLLIFLDASQFLQLAIMMTEFGEDTWYELGMWDALEAHNLQIFGNPLPFSKPEKEEASDFPFDEYRLSHFLWNAMMVLRGEEYFSPHHMSLLPLAERLSYFLEKKFEGLPRQSSVKKFLSSPNTSGSVVKRKLVWMGTKSYLFRVLCNHYLYEHDALDAEVNEQIPCIDDFLCQECTLWSGMGVLDVLAHTLSLTETQKEEVLSWYERHFAYYEILGFEKNGLKAKNIITGTVYEFPEETKSHFSPFKKGMVIMGACVPFDGKWYWSGIQRQLGSVSRHDLGRLKAEFCKKSSSIVYRYDKERAAKAAEQTKGYHAAFVEFFGSDMAEFKTGREAANAMIAKLEYQQKKILGDEKFEKQKEKFRLADITAESVYSPEFLEEDGGICAFSNPGIGDELITHFFAFKKSLKKQGKGLNMEELELLQDFFMTDTISKEALERLAAEFGKDSFATAFFLHKKPKYWFDYLLRKFKGQDFRNRYPNLTILDE
jgi:Protein of unknown function (DUF3843)